MPSHEDSSTTSRAWTISAKSLNFAVVVDLVVLEYSQLYLLPLVFGLFGGGVSLLLSLFRTTSQTKDEMKRAFLLDVVVAESATVFELLAGKDETLLVGGDSFLILDFGLYIVDGI